MGDIIVAPGLSSHHIACPTTNFVLHSPTKTKPTFPGGVLSSPEKSNTETQ